MRTGTVTGIGCFAKPATLSRVFLKMMRNYTLGEFVDINLVHGRGRQRGPEAALMLKALISGNAEYTPLQNSGCCHPVENSQITGFFLTLRNQQLNLSIFARGDRESGKTYTTILDGFTALRQKRLN